MRLRVLAVCLLALLLGGAGPGTAEFRPMEPVLGPLPDVIRLDVPSALENRALAALGLVDVTAAPFFADPSGRRDSTRALQRAIDFARDRQMVCFLPGGTYLIRDTLSCIQPLYMRTSGKPNDGRYFPCVLLGSRLGPRPKILLAPRSPGFGDPDNPKYVVHFWARSRKDPEKPQPNISMNQMLVNIDVAVGPGNAGAVGIRHRAAQGSGIEECEVDVTHGHCGIEGGAGSGGGHAGITVVGGDVGLDLRETQPASSITGVVLRGQRSRAILYSGRQTLSAVGVRIESGAPGPVVETRKRRGDPHSGEMSLVDATVEMSRKGDVAFGAGGGLYLENVAVSGPRVVVAGPKGRTVVPGEAGKTVRVGRFAMGVDPVPWKGYQYVSPVMVDGTVLPRPLFEPGRSDPPGPQAHLWPADFPGFETPGAANVKNAPYLARGDGGGDDTAALQAAIDAADTVFLPKGVYRISRPLELRPATRLVGLAKHLSIIAPVPGAPAFADPAAPAPLLRTSGAPDAATIVAFLGLFAPPEYEGAYCLHWRCGPASVLRDVAFMSFPSPGGFKRPGNPVPRDFPLVLVDGAGAGRWYNFYQESYRAQAPGYRHLLIRDTPGPLAVYQCNAEHGRGEANVEIASARNVSLFGLKGEGNQPVLRVRDSRRVAVYGYGGNAAGLAGRALFELVGDCSATLVGLVDSPLLEGRGHESGAAGVGRDPHDWVMVQEFDSGGGPRGGSAPMARPMAYIRGNVGGDLGGREDGQ